MMICPAVKFDGAVSVSVGWPAVPLAAETMLLIVVVPEVTLSEPSWPDPVSGGAWQVPLPNEPMQTPLAQSALAPQAPAVPDVWQVPAVQLFERQFGLPELPPEHVEPAAPHSICTFVTLPEIDALPLTTVQ